MSSISIYINAMLNTIFRIGIGLAITSLGRIAVGVVVVVVPLLVGIGVAGTKSSAIATAR